MLIGSSECIYNHSKIVLYCLGMPQNNISMCNIWRQHPDSVVCDLVNFFACIQSINFNYIQFQL